MTDSYRPPPKSPHRFVPTLTEVVSPSLVTPPTVAPEITQEVLERMIEQATRRASEALTRKLPETLAELLQAQLPTLSERLSRELEAAVLQSVKTALTRTFPQLGALDRPALAPSAHTRADD